MSLSTSEGTNLDERSAPYQVCVDLSESPTGGDLTVTITSTGSSATCKSDVKSYAQTIVCVT